MTDYNPTGRRDAEGPSSGPTMGFITKDGAPRPVTGDSLPHVKDPPQITLPAVYGKDIPLPQVTQVGDYWVGQPIPTEGYRLLELIMFYTPTDIGGGVGAGELSVLAEKRLLLRDPTSNAEPYVWVPQGVVNPVLNTPAIEPGYAWRSFYQSELRFLPFAVSAGAPTELAISLTFDVSTAPAWRFRFGDLDGSTSVLSVSYLLQR